MNRADRSCRALACAALLALAVSAGACKSSSSEGAPPPPPPDATAPAELVGNWILAELDRERIAVPEGSARPTLEIGSDGSVAGFAGVNRFTGSLDPAELALRRFELGTLAVTKMAGSPEAMRLEDRTLRALDGATGYVVDAGDGDLELTDSQAIVVARYERLPPDNQ